MYGLRFNNGTPNFALDTYVNGNGFSQFSQHCQTPLDIYNLVGVSNFAQNL